MINDVSFNVSYGDLISIIGPNGSGKSTLIKLISGQLIPSKGSVKINDKNLDKWDLISLAKIRSILSQSHNLSFPFKVIDIVRMGRSPFKGENSNKNHEICKILIKKFDLENYINRNYITLSGGEKQRVHLARVIAQIWSYNNFKNKLLILDEPTSFLDIKHQCFLFQFLKQLNKKGLSIILVLHDLNQALDISNKILMLKDSNLIHYSSKNDCINKKKIKMVFDVDLDIIKDNKLNKNFITFKSKGK